MRVVFLSNYFNHHQKSFCDAMYDKLGDDFFFVGTSQMREERKKMGYSMENIPGYVFHTDDGFEKKIIDDSDVVIFGSAPEELLCNRIKNNKLIFRYTERPLKQGNSLIKYVLRYLRWHKNNPLNKPIFLLCASAFTSLDYSKFGLFKEKAFKWGYFPETKIYENVSELIYSKDCGKILWCGRFINWKHPDDAINAAFKLKSEGYKFELDFIGTGEMEDRMVNMINEKGLSDCVKILGAMKPEQVREHMENSDIYLFTSDKQEGWGAVLNESMNSGCAVVASHIIGSVPFLIENGKNGLVYESCNVEMLYKNIKYLLDNPQEKVRLGLAAYNTIANEWNAEVAAERFVNLTRRILDGAKNLELYESGPCSKAEIIKERWLKF